MYILAPAIISVQKSWEPLIVKYHGVYYYIQQYMGCNTDGYSHFIQTTKLNNHSVSHLWTIRDKSLGDHVICIHGWLGRIFPAVKCRFFLLSSGYQPSLKNQVCPAIQRMILVGVEEIDQGYLCELEKVTDAIWTQNRLYIFFSPSLLPQDAHFYNSHIYKEVLMNKEDSYICAKINEESEGRKWNRPTNWDSTN